MENENEKIHQSDIWITGGIQRTTPTTRTTGSSANGKSKMLTTTTMTMTITTITTTRGIASIHLKEEK